MTNQSERPRITTSEAAEVEHRDSDPTAPASAVSIHDKLVWGWDDITALTGLSRRLLERQLSAGKMPRPDLRVGRRVLWRPSTIKSWIGGGQS
jgi:predicted DNA-binding transcriptional regulator AlpA